MDTEIESAQKVDPGDENSPATRAGTRTQDLSITSPATKPLSYSRSPQITVSLASLHSVVGFLFARVQNVSSA